MATNLYTTIQGLDVTQDELLKAELVAEKILEARFPDLDLRQGTGLRDLVIRPSATLLALVEKAVAYYFAQNTLPGVTDESPTEIVDKILSNWFVERKSGKKSVISARLFFAQQKNVTVGSEVFFSTDNKKRFYPVSTYSFSPSELSYESFSAEYFVDIDLVADREGAEYDLTSGSLLYFSNFDPYFLRGEINYLKEKATVTETNTQFISRTRTAVSTRNLINVPSIEARLKEDFDYITHVTSVGMGDPDMYRDQVEVMTPQLLDPVMIHIGGKTDVYAKVPLETQIYQFTADDEGVCTIEGPYISISRSTFTGGEEDDTIPVNLYYSVSAISYSGQTATATCEGHTFQVGDQVTVAGAFPSVYNGTFAVTQVSANSFTYVLPSTPSAVASGTIAASKPMPYEVSHPNRIIKSASLSKSGDTVTVGVIGHGIMPGRYVRIFNASEGFNGWFKVESATRGSFTVKNPLDLPPTSSGSPLIEYTNYLEDFGFSSRQTLEVDFGPGFAGKTASFSVTGFQGLSGIQNYLSDGSRRVLGGDMLARGYNLYHLSVHIVGYNGAPPSAAQCGKIVEEYLGSLEPGAPFIMADLISRLNSAGVKTIRTPVQVAYKFYHRDNIDPIEGTIADFLEPLDGTAVFMLDSLTTSNEYI